MSIFKSTFKEFVKEQITVREEVLSSGGPKRDIILQEYVTANAPWAKMTSFVDYESIGNYKLAQNYTLYGGTLFYQRDSQGAVAKTRLRSGIYGESNILQGAAYGSSLGNNQDYGIRPMPGIESISVRSLGAYGSLRETTINYYAWDLTQLQNLNILYMKPGYPVLVEWGWSLYLDKNKSINKEFVPIDVFNLSLTPELVYSKIDESVRKYKGNYDASLGIIKNYSYTLMPNGGFQCSTVLISLGEVIESLKVNSVSFTQTEKTTETKDEFDILMTTISNFQYSGDDIQNPTTPLPSPSFKRVIETSPADATVYTFGSGSVGDTKNLPAGDVRYTKFINFAFFIHILNNSLSLFTGPGENFVKIEIPLDLPGNMGSGNCVASKNSMSINNSVCFIVNSEATLLDKEFGFSPEVSPNITREYVKYLNSSSNIGQIGNIYVNIGHIISTYKELHVSSGGVFLLDFLKKLLSSISYTLGSVNNFDVLSINNKAIIIDKHYVEDFESSRKENKFQLNIMGVRTTVRDHKVVSKIFSEQSNMIAIAAQDRENVASVQTSTQVEMNKNIYNRLYPNVSNRESLDEKEDRDIVFSNIQNLLFFVKKYIVPGKKPVYEDVTLAALNMYLNQLITVADGGTNYKAIIPITLEVKMDGISGITIGEIFRINANILPTEYNDKNVGFIVTGIAHDITRADWITTLTTQFCLLDQQEKYERSLVKADNFYKGLFEYLENVRPLSIASIKYFNVLTSFLEDFFSDILIAKNFANSNPIIEYGENTNENQKRVKKCFENFNIESKDPTLFFREMAKISARAFFNKNKNLNPYTNTPGGGRDSTSLPFLVGVAYSFDSENPTKINKNSIKSYLDYVMFNNSYYIKMSQNNQKVKRVFDEVYKQIIAKYLGAPGDFELAFSYIADLVNVTSPQSFVNLGTKLFIINKDTEVFISYLNDNCLDPKFAVIDPEKLFLTEGVTIPLKKVE